MRLARLTGVARVTIDGRSVEIDDGRTILDAMRREGTVIPALCHDDRVAPAGACRLCLVEVRGTAKPVPACATAIADGMEIATRTAALETGRREILEMLARRILTGGGHDRLSIAMRAYGVAPCGTPDPALVDDSHPYIRVDMAKCIDCFLSEQICHELQGQDTWHAVERDGRLRLVPDTGAPLGRSSCEGIELVDSAIYLAAVRAAQAHLACDGLAAFRMLEGAYTYRRVVRFRGRFPIAIDTLGYRIELVAPIPVDVLPGRIHRSRNR